MRFLIALPLLLAATLAWAQTPSPQAFNKVFELAGIGLLCEQTAPLLLRGLPDAQQAALAKVFAAETLCLDLAKQLAPQFSVKHLQQAQALLESPLAQHFTAAERAVGANEAELASYREQLSSRPPRADRLALVQRLDSAAQTTALAALLRYEVGKTQALLALKAQGGSIDEATLSSKTTAQRDALRESSQQGVQSFMLFAYRQTPSAQLAEYAALYEQEPVKALLKASVQALPKVFAARRAALK
ncbi:MAG: hypothetical protein Q8R10_11090 [Pseudomonas sp.]|uniref:hypothetical protein n=1 Tax=Pseudomonas sp. TaxID=306 RepID=UPI0027349ABC|nr:hypothetical protein [Pseudomonas sp.]MDP3846953.1 hypothetical protein [Pseudomonas sp.]